MGVKLKQLLYSVFSTIRPVNLLIICLCLLLIRYFLVIPILQYSNFTSSIDDFTYTLLILAIVMIAAGGYVINDLFDIGVDKINKPGKNKIGDTISKQQAIGLYIFLTVAGLIFSFIVGQVTDKNYITVINLVCAGLLYFYAASYKKMFLVGNIIISLLSALTIYSSVLYDHHALLSEPVTTLVFAYSIFAFVMTLIREIVKDCEDASGDQSFGSSTLPIITGIKTARIITFSLTIMVLIAVLYIQVIQKQWENKFAFGYILFLVQLPLSYLAIKIISASKKSDDHHASNTAKFIMLTGILSIPVFYFTSI